MYLSGAPVNSLEWPKSTFDYKQASKPFHCFVFFYFSWFLPGSSSAVKTPRNALSALCWMCVPLQLLWKTQRWSSDIRKTFKNYHKIPVQRWSCVIYSSVRISWFNSQKLCQLLGHSAAIDLSTDSVRQNILRVASFTYFCLFVLVYNKFAQTDREKKLFSLKGDHNSR